MKGITSAIALVLFLCSPVLLAQPAVVLPGEGASTHKIVVSEAAVEQKKIELLLIKEQNRLIKDFQSSQQATVYWALSGIFAFVVVLMGLSYFTNFKFYQQDKDRIKADFESRLMSYSADMNLQLEESKRDVDKVVERNNQLIQDRNLLQLSEMRVFVESVRSELITEIKSIKNSFASFEGDLKSVGRKLAIAEVEWREVEMGVWELKKVPVNMLISLGQALCAAAECESKVDAIRVIKKMQNVVDEKFLKANLSIDREILDMLNDDLKVAASLKPVGLAKLKSALAKVLVEDEEELV